MHMLYLPASVHMRYEDVALYSMIIYDLFAPLIEKVTSPFMGLYIWSSVRAVLYSGLFFFSRHFLAVERLYDTVYKLLKLFPQL